MLSKKIGMLFTFLDSALLPQLLNGLYGEGGDEMSRELKPCPFCGGEAEIQGITIVWIKCKQCGTSTWGFKEEKRAIDLWNSRKSEAEEEVTT